MALKEYKPEKLLYTMGEVTEMFDVKPSHIRFWVDRFDILKPKKNKKGNRLFTPEDVKNLEVIYHLTKERGMTLAGVEKYLKNNKAEAEHETEIVRRLQTIRSLLVEIREELKEEGEGEIRVFTADASESEVMMETLVEAIQETVIVVEETPEEEVEQPVEQDLPQEEELPNPFEFAEETVLGEAEEADDEPESDFWAEEETETNEEPDPGEEESKEWLNQDDIPDEEISVPFTAQPLFDLEEAKPTLQQEEIEESQPKEAKPTMVDTQQSLF